MKRTRPSVAVIALLALGLIALAGCRQQQQAPQPPRPQASRVPAAGAAVGRTAPDFTLTPFEGKAISLSSLKGKPVAVMFWTSTCHFCAQEAPDLDALYRQYKGQGLEVLGVGLDDPEALLQKAQQLKLTFPVGYNAQAGQQYAISGVPHTFFIDRQGRIAASLLGARPTISGRGAGGCWRT